MNKIFLIGIIVIFGSILTIAGINMDELAYAQGNSSFTATLSGKEVVPPVKTGGTGMTNFEVSDNSISYQTNVLNAGKITSVEIHKGAAGTNGEAIAIVFKPKNSSGNLLGDLPKIGNMPKFSDISSTTQKSSSFSASGNINESSLTGPMKGKTISDLISALQSGETYVVVHTEDHPKGELRGQITENKS
jgi:CHRD domain